MVAIDPAFRRRHRRPTGRGGRPDRDRGWDGSLKQHVLVDDVRWARYFAPGEGYLGTEMLRSADGRYLVIDRWRSAADYDAFLGANADEYGARNRGATRLWLRERALGRFEVR